MAHRPAIADHSMCFQHGNAGSSTVCFHWVSVYESERKEKNREMEKENKAISTGIKPKPQDISDLEGDGV